MKIEQWFSIQPFPDAIRVLMALAQIGDTTFDPGSWLTNLFLKVPSDPQIAEILRELMRNKGIDFTEVSR